MSVIKTISPPPVCFSCGNELLEADFDLFHSLTEEYTTNGIVNPEDGKIILLTREVAWKYILDCKLSKIYGKRCCRLMFMGDAYEYRKDMALYNLDKLNDHVTF